MAGASVYRIPRMLYGATNRSIPNCVIKTLASSSYFSKHFYQYTYFPFIPVFVYHIPCRIYWSPLVSASTHNVRGLTYSFGFEPFSNWKIVMPRKL